MREAWREVAESALRGDAGSAEGAVAAAALLRCPFDAFCNALQLLFFALISVRVCVCVCVSGLVRDYLSVYVRVSLGISAGRAWASRVSPLEKRLQLAYSAYVGARFSTRLSSIQHHFIIFVCPGLGEGGLAVPLGPVSPAL